MSCPTCGHTMALLCIAGNGTYYLCPRCGTVRRSAGHSTEDYTPKLVERCRGFEAHLDGSGLATPEWREWKRCRIAESINPPGQRSTP